MSDRTKSLSMKKKLIKIQVHYNHVFRNTNQILKAWNEQIQETMNDNNQRNQRNKITQ